MGSYVRREARERWMRRSPAGELEFVGVPWEVVAKACRKSHCLIKALGG